MAMLAMVMRSSMESGRDPRTAELHRAIGGAVETDFADQMENDVLGHHPRLELPLQAEGHRLGHFEEQLAGPQHEPGVGVADAGGELVKGSRRAGMRIGAEQDLAGAGMGPSEARRCGRPRRSGSRAGVRIGLWRHRTAKCRWGRQSHRRNRAALVPGRIGAAG